MEKNEITFVTAFFKIREKEGNKNTEGFCSLEKYLECSKELLEKDMNLIIFIEPELKEFILNMRKSMIHKTVIITKKFEDLNLWSRYQEFVNNDNRYHVSNLDRRKFTPLYYLIINSKVDMVEEAILLNPFKTDKFAWIDFRALDLSYINNDFFRRIPEIANDNLIHINMMALTTQNEIENRNTYYSMMRGKVAATFWIGGRMELLQFIKKCQKELDWCLKNGWAVTEEQIFGVILCENPELFNVYCGDYCDSLSNFDISRRNLWLSASAFKYAIMKEQTDMALHLGRYMINSHFHNEGAKMDTYHLYEVYYNMILIYSKLLKSTELLSLIKEWIEIANNNLELKEKIKSKKDFLFGLIYHTKDFKVLEQL